MPIYNYQCNGCGEQVEKLRPMSESDAEGPLCFRCRTRMKRVFVASLKRNKNFRTPIEMFSVAPDNPAELAELRRKCPDVEFTPELVPLAHNRQEKMRILAAVGFEERS